jgi:hypothetical protein
MFPLTRTRLYLPFAALLALPAFCQEADRFIPVKAPAAQRLVQKISANHPEMEFIGLHVTPPRKSDNVIIACTDSSKLGKVSTDRDMELVKAKDTKVQYNKAHNYYEVDQWFADSGGNTLGMIVYHFSAEHAKSEEEAVKLATNVRGDLQKRIPNLQSLFQN